MKMGIERGVLRWDIHESLLRARLRRVEDSLRGLETAPEPKPSERLSALQRDRDELLRALNSRGPSPRAKMG